jgi:hypothetical protein
MSANGMGDGNEEITYIDGIYKMSASFYYVPEGQITQPAPVIICLLMAKGNTSLLISDELDTGKCDNRERLGTLLRSLFLYKHAFRKTFHLDRREILYKVSHFCANVLVFGKFSKLLRLAPLFILYLTMGQTVT